MTKELLFSVTAKDCKFDYYRGTGAGGQKRNKTSSAVRCTHISSGAVGQSEDSRSQHENKRIAFVRMAETPKFKAWHRIEVAKTTGELARIQENVEQAMRPKNLLVEGKNEKGLWEPLDN